jgi:hypothetical protein
MPFTCSIRDGFRVDTVSPGAPPTPVKLSRKARNRPRERRLCGGRAARTALWELARENIDKVHLTDDDKPLE